MKTLLLQALRFNKKNVAIKKILKHHQHFDMQPFFEWDLKVLPLAIKWFERARSIDSNGGRRKEKAKCTWVRWKDCLRRGIGLYFDSDGTV